MGRVSFMKKKWITLGTTLVMTAAMAFPAIAAIDYETARLHPDFTIVIDGKEKNFKRADGSAAFALVYEDSTYLPLRVIGEIMDKSVEWDNQTKTVTLTSKGLTVTDADTFGDRKGKEPVTDADNFKDKNKDKKKVVRKDIGIEKAKKIALQHAGLKENEVSRLKAEKDYDDGRIKYDVEFQQGRMEYDYEIHAETGKILKAEKDYDD